MGWIGGVIVLMLFVGWGVGYQMGMKERRGQERRKTLRWMGKYEADHRFH